MALRSHAAATVGLVIALLALVAAPSAAAAQTALPDIDVALILEIRDPVRWLALYEEVLGTARPTTKALGVTVPAGTGARRSIAVMQPKFDVAMVKGATGVKVVIYGKIAASEALRGLTAFQRAVLEMQSGATTNEAVLSYGLADASGQLLEFHLSRS